jgi:hypothetical protein
MIAGASVAGLYYINSSHAGWINVDASVHKDRISSIEKLIVKLKQESQDESLIDVLDSVMQVEVSEFDLAQSQKSLIDSFLYLILIVTFCYALLLWAYTRDNENV